MPDDKTHQEMTLYEVYRHWEASLEDCMREVKLLRSYLQQLKQTEKQININVMLQTSPVGYQDYYISQSVATSTITQYNPSVSMPYVIYSPNIASLDQVLNNTPQNTENWLKTIKKSKAELDISVQTVINLGVLKKAKEQQ